MTTRIPALVACATALVACIADEPTSVDAETEHSQTLADLVAGEARSQVLSDPAVGVSLAVPASWSIYRDPVLFDTYGFVVFGQEPDASASEGGMHERPAVARVALAYKAKPDQLEA